MARSTGIGASSKTAASVGAAPRVNDAQKTAWCQTIEAFDEGSRRARQIALFPEDRAAPPLDCDVVHVRLNELRLCRLRQWGGCWLAGELWNQLQLDEFWSARLPPSRQGTRWLSVPKTLVAYRLTDPGSEWRLHRQWYQQTAMSELLGEDFGLACKDKLYRCLDKLVRTKRGCSAFCSHAGRRCSKPNSTFCSTTSRACISM